MELWELCEAFILDAGALAGMTASTRKTYKARVHQFCRWASAGGDGLGLSPADLSPAALRRYVHHLSARGLRPRTVKGSLDALRAFGAWLVRGGHLAVNPAAGMGSPRLDAPRRERVPDTDVSALLDACLRLHPPRRAALARAVVSVLAYAGLRRAECLSLRLGDVPLPQGAIVVRQGKGNKARTVYPHAECLAALRAWLRLRPACQDDWLFALDTRRRLHFDGLRTLMAQVSAGAGLATPVRPHDLRHAYATRQLAGGTDVSTVQALLGHASLQTTALYLRTDDQRLKDAAGQGGLRVGSEGGSGQKAQEGPPRRREGRGRASVRVRRVREGRG